MPRLRRKPSETELARRAAEQAAADLTASRARTDDPGEEDADDGREATGQPSPGSVPDTTTAVERVYKEELAAPSDWSRFRERVEHSERESERAARERIADLERRIERARLTAKHAPTHAKRQAVERKLDRLDAEHSALFASLNAPVTD